MQMQLHRKPEQRLVKSKLLTGMCSVCVEQTIVRICLWEEGALDKTGRAVGINCLLL